MADYQLSYTGDEVQEALDRGRDLHEMKEGAIPKKGATDMEPSAMSEDDDVVVSEKSLEVPPNTLYVSENLGLKGSGEAFGVFDKANDRLGFLVAYEEALNARPFYRKLDSVADGVVIQGIKSADSPTQDTTDTITLKKNRLITALYIEPSESASSASVALKRGGYIVAESNDITFVADTEEKIDIPQGVFFPSGAVIEIEIKGAKVKGKQVSSDFSIYLKLDSFEFTKKQLATLDDIVSSGSMSWQQIVQAATDDTTGTKLDASYISNLPSGSAMTGTEIIDAIINDPAEPKLPAEDVADLTNTDYVESSGQHLFDPVNYTYYEIVFEGTGAATQTMPNIVNSRDMFLLMIRNQKTDDSPVTLLPANSGQYVDGTSTFTLDVGVSALFVCMKARNDWHKLADFEHTNGPVTAGVTFANATADVAGVTKVNVPTSELLIKGNGEVDLVPYITLRNMPPSQKDNLAKEIHLQLPLKTFPDPDAQEVGQVYIDPAAYEPQHAPGLLAQLSTNEGVIGTSRGSNEEHDGVVFCDNFITPAGEYFDVRRPEKAYGIQDGADEDPNVTGGMPTEVMASVGFIGSAPEDGVVRCYWRTKNIISGVEDYLLDPSGNPIIIERNYKAGDKFVDELVAGVVEAKGLEYVRLHVMHTLGAEVLLIDHTRTYICLQQKMHGYQTSVAKLEFERRVGASLTPRVEYMGVDSVVLRSYLGTDQPASESDPGAKIAGLGQFGIHALTKVSLSISSKVLTLTNASDGSITDFAFHQIEDFETTQMARGHNVKYEVKINDKDMGWNLVLFAWEGNPNEYTPLYDSRNNGSLNINTGWKQVAATFISEDAVSGIHTASVAGTIPDTANNFGVFLYPVSAQTPMTLKLSDLTLSYDPPFTGFLESSPELDAEKHLVFDERYKEFTQNTQGFQSLRYTLDTTVDGLPMPAGISGKGAADITLDASVNQVPGSGARGGEGALKFTVDGDVKISTTLNLWNEQSTDNSATFWWSEVSTDGNTFTKIPESEDTFTVKANTDKHGSLFNMPAFKFSAQVGSRLALRGKSNKADGAYIECISDKQPMVQTICTFDELVASLTTDPSTRLTKSELRVVEFSNIAAQNYTFEFKVPDGVEIGAHSVVIVDGSDNLVSISDSEFSYNPTTEEMTVHVGNNQNGKIYMTLWSA